jgi:hypothetical protein
MGLVEQCFPPMRWPGELESLTTGVGIIINNSEHGKLEQLMKGNDGLSHHYQKLMHRYDKLFDYVEQGYNERMKTGWKNYIINDAVRLWSYYENAVTHGIIGQVTRGDYNPFLKISSIKTPEQCYEEYLQPARKAWNRLQRLQPVAKKNFKLLKHFNQVTGAIGARECDSEIEWQFNEEKDEWKHDYRKDILIFHY